MGCKGVYAKVLGQTGDDTLESFFHFEKAFLVYLSLTLSQLLEGFKSIPILRTQKLRQGGSER